jgi:ribose transport system ATP-binding protein
MQEDITPKCYPWIIFYVKEICMNNGNLLEMRNICKSFPGVLALDKVNFELKPGEVHVLVGENGAGKSTLIKILSGAYRSDSGEIYINGNLVEIEEPRRAFNLGITVIYQEFNLNPFTPIYENVFLGREFKSPLGFLNTSKAIKETKRLLSMVGLHVSPKTLVSQLGVAQKQLVEIAKAMSIKANIIVFDEPTSALSDKEIDYLFCIINDLKKGGCGIIYVSHRLEEIFQIGDRCTVFRDGRYIGTKLIRNVHVKDLVNMIVGREFNESKRTATFVRKKNILRVEGLSYKEVLKNINFDLREGEILGVAGLMGSGRTELAKCIIGEYSKTSGEISIGKELAKIQNVCDALKNGIVYLSEDRRKEGLFLGHQVKNNITISSLPQFINKGFLNSRRESKSCKELKNKLQIKTPTLSTLAKNLSGGNQQKVVIAKWLLTMAKVFIFDEPTRGIDVGAKDEIHKIMEELVKEGASIIMISSEIPEILKMSDRIMVMRLGIVEAILENTNLSQEDVFQYEIGAHKFQNEKNVVT